MKAFYPNVNNFTKKKLSVIKFFLVEKAISLYWKNIVERRTA